MTNYEKRIILAGILLENINDPGRFGRAFELTMAPKNSTKKAVGKVGETDILLYFKDETLKSGKRRIPCEVKTNGGRVDSLLNGTNKAKFVVYRMDFIQKHRAGKKTPAREEHRYIPPVIIPTEIFLQALVACNALKAINHNGEQDGVGIQVSSKKFYEWLLDWPIPYDPDKVYTLDDFDGLTV